MISIIYPQGDFEAADIAIKTQALAQSSGKKIYIVPKHFGRNHDAVFQNLSKTTTALFLAFEKFDLDDDTQSELEYLLGRRVQVFGVIPDTMDFPFFDEDSFEIVTYPQHGKWQAIAKISDVIKKISPNSQSPSGNETNVAVIMTVLLLLVIILTISAQGTPARRPA